VIYLDVCCNDPDNGGFTGRAVGLSIGCAEWDATDIFRGSTFKEVDGGIVLSGKRWEVENSKDWIGNWCWNRYLLAKGKITVRWYMVEFITWLRRRKMFHLTTAPTDFFDWWESGADIAPADVHALVCNLEDRIEPKPLSPVAQEQLRSFGGKRLD
jgi:hypothetical protein